MKNLKGQSNMSKKLNENCGEPGVNYGGSEWVDADGNKPSPRKINGIKKSISLVVPLEIHRIIEKEAAYEKVSMTSLIREAIDELVKKIGRLRALQPYETRDQDGEQDASPDNR
jgi:hypothetical protein